MKVWGGIELDSFKPCLVLHLLAGYLVFACVCGPYIDPVPHFNFAGAEFDALLPTVCWAFKTLACVHLDAWDEPYWGSLKPWAPGPI